MPSSWRDGSEGKRMCRLSLTQSKATQALLRCGTEGLLPATLIPQTVYIYLKKKTTTKGVLTINVPDTTSQMEHMYTTTLKKMLCLRLATIEIQDKRGGWVVAEYMYSNLTELQVEIDCNPKCKQEKTVLIGLQSVNMCKFIFYLASKNRGEYLCVFPCKILTKILARSRRELSNLAAKNSPRFQLRSC